MLEDLRQALCKELVQTQIEKLFHQFTNLQSDFKLKMILTQFIQLKFPH